MLYQATLDTSQIHVAPPLIKWSSTITQEIYPLTKDGYLKAAEFSNAEITNKFWTKRKMGVAAVALVFAASNADEVNRWSQFNSEGEMIPSVPYCQIDEVTAGEERPKEEVEESVKKVQSAANDFSTTSVSFNEVIGQTKEYMENESQRFAMQQSGIEVVVHAPPGVQVDETKFAELFHAPLTLDDEYQHPQIRQLVDCWRRDIIEEKKYAGTVYHVHVSQPEHCIEGMRFQPADEVEDCDAVGATMPEFELSFLGLNVLNYNLMMLSTRKPVLEANQSISKVLLHESTHAYMTLSDQPMRLNPDEKLAKRVEEVTRAHLYPGGMPQAIRYP